LNKKGTSSRNPFDAVAAMKRLQQSDLENQHRMKLSNCLLMCKPIQVKNQADLYEHIMRPESKRSQQNDQKSSGNVSNKSMEMV